MVGVQLMAFSGIQTRRERWKEGIKSKKEADKSRRSQDNRRGMDDVRAVDEFQVTVGDMASSKANGLDANSPQWCDGKSSDRQSNSDESEESQESEIIL